MVNKVRLLVLTLVATAGLSFAAPAQSMPQAQINATLEADAQLWQGLFALAVADEIRKNCDQVEPRTVRATNAVWGLYNRARGYGFSRQEIRAFQVAETTKARMTAEVLAYFAQHGVREGVPDTYCALGRSEIAAGTQAGELLRAR